LKLNVFSFGNLHASLGRYGKNYRIMNGYLKHFQREGLKEFGHTSPMKACEGILNYKNLGNFSKEGHPRNLATPPQKKEVEWRNFPRRHSWNLTTFLHIEGFEEVTQCMEIWRATLWKGI
jgi:hypothetical protein